MSGNQLSVILYVEKYSHQDPLLNHHCLSHLFKRNGLFCRDFLYLLYLAVQKGSYLFFPLPPRCLCERNPGLPPLTVSYSSDSRTSRSKALVRVVGYTSLPQFVELLRTSRNFSYLASSLLMTKHVTIIFSFSLFLSSFVVKLQLSFPIISLLTKICSPPANFNASTHRLESCQIVIVGLIIPLFHVYII